MKGFVLAESVLCGEREPTDCIVGFWRGDVFKERKIKIKVLQHRNASFNQKYEKRIAEHQQKVHSQHRRIRQAIPKNYVYYSNVFKLKKLL